MLRILYPRFVAEKYSCLLYYYKSTMEYSDSSENIKEGSAVILVKPGAQVFYNPVQEFNRDLSVAVLKLCVEKYFDKLLVKIKNQNKSELSESLEPTTKPIKILEALSATGLRSIRYAKEIPGVTEIIANDLSYESVEIIKANIKANEVELIVKTQNDNAVDVMMRNRREFAAVDIDPYGCPSIFLDSAVQSVCDGGILLVTCTDMSVLCGNSPNTCYVKYGAISLKNKACHEMALRIVLQNIESHATRYKRFIVPLLSVSVDFYVRVFVQVFTSASECKNTTSKLSMVYQCNGCETLTLQPLGIKRSVTNESGNTHIKHSLPNVPAVSDTCVHCGSKHHMGGPIWSDPIHNEEFVNDLLNIIKTREFGTKKRLEGVLNVIREELFNVPLYYCLDRLFSVVHATSMSMMTMRSAILNGGYLVSYSHANKSSIKTNAPMSFLWDIVRTWTKEHPVSLKKLNNNSAAKKLLSISTTAEINLSIRYDANPLSREMKLVRFQENPTAFWGPGTKSVINVEPNEKKRRNQNKKRKREISKDSSIIEDNSEIQEEI